MAKKNPPVPNNTANVNDLATSSPQRAVPLQRALQPHAFQKGPHIAKMPPPRALNALIHPAAVLENPEKPREILVDDNGHLVGIKINKDDVENDPTLLNRYAANESDLRKTRQDAYQQLKANRPDKTIKGYGKCKRLWKVKCPAVAGSPSSQLLKHLLTMSPSVQ